MLPCSTTYIHPIDTCARACLYTSRHLFSWNINTHCVHQSKSKVKRVLLSVWNLEERPRIAAPSVILRGSVEMGLGRSIVRRRVEPTANWSSAAGPNGTNQGKSGQCRRGCSRTQLQARRIHDGPRTCNWVKRRSPASSVTAVTVTSWYSGVTAWSVM